MKTCKLTAWGLLWAGVLCLGLGCGGATEPDSSATTDASPAAESSAETHPEATDAEQAAAATEQKEGTAETTSAETSTALTPADVQLKMVDKGGYDAAIAAHQGKVVLVDFWATWCIPCQKKFPETVEWSRKYGHEGLAVVSMSMDEADQETQTRVREFLAKHNATFTNLLSSLGGDEDGMNAFEIDGGALPHFKLYGRDGTLLQKFGEGDPENPFKSSDIEAAIQKALAAK